MFLLDIMKAIERKRMKTTGLPLNTFPSQPPYTPKEVLDPDYLPRLFLVIKSFVYSLSLFLAENLTFAQVNCFCSGSFSGFSS